MAIYIYIVLDRISFIKEDTLFEVLPREALPSYIGGGCNIGETNNDIKNWVEQRLKNFTEPNI